MTDIAEEVSDMLKLCAHKLLLAYDENAHPSLWIAFEKTYEALDNLINPVHTKPITVH